MTSESALIKPITDAILSACRIGTRSFGRAKAQKAVAEALAELWKVSPNINRAEAAIIGAELAGMISADLLRAKERLNKVKTFRSKKAAKKVARRLPAKKAAKKLRRNSFRRRF
jgi:hypothetical protein